MTARTEQQCAVFVAERSVVCVCSYCVCARLLLRETNVERNVELLLHIRQTLCHLLLEEFEMVVRNREVNVSLTVRASIERCFYEMLLHRSARTILVLMEQQQALRQLTIVQALCLKQVCYDSLILAVLDKVANTFAFVLLALCAKSLLESELLDIVEEELFEVGSRLVIVGRKERKEILEHTARSSTCRHELHDSMLVA